MYVKIGQVNHRHHRTVDEAERAGYGQTIADVSGGRAVFKQSQVTLEFAVDAIIIRPTLEVGYQRWGCNQFFIYHVERNGRVQVIARLHNHGLCYVQRDLQVTLVGRDALSLPLHQFPDGVLRTAHLDDHGRPVKV